MTPRAYRHHWGPKEDARLIDLYNDRSLSIAKVATSMGRSESSVRGRLQKLRLAGVITGRRSVGGRPDHAPDAPVSAEAHHIALTRIDELERQIAALRLRHGHPIAGENG